MAIFYGFTYVGLRVSHKMVYRVTWNNSIDRETGTRDTSVNSETIRGDNEILEYAFKPLAFLELAIRPDAKPLP